MRAGSERDALLVRNQQGILPAFWALGADFRPSYSGWPIVSEWDILEAINVLPTVYSTLHCGYAPGGPYNEYNGIGNGGVAWTGCDWHILGFEVDRRAAAEENVEKRMEKKHCRGISMARKPLKYLGLDSMTRLHGSQSHTRATSCCLMLPWVGIGRVSLTLPLWTARLSRWRSIMFVSGTLTEGQRVVDLTVSLCHYQSLLRGELALSLARRCFMWLHV